MASSLVEARILYRTVIDLPILPQLAAQIGEEAIIKSIFGTAAIEGNPLKEEEVAEILSKSGETEKLERAEKEIRNLNSPMILLLVCNGQYHLFAKVGYKCVGAGLKPVRKKLAH